MAERSKRIELFDENKIKLINTETIRHYKRYEMDMSIRELSPKTIYGYKTDLFSWFIYIAENQDNISITEVTDEDIEDFIFYCKTQGNNSRRIKRRMSSMSAFFKFLRKKRIVNENPLEFLDRPRKDADVVQQTFLTQEQVDLMKKTLHAYGDLQLEVYASLSLSTMARVNAISNITWKQIDFYNRTIVDVLEKEGYVVTLLFSESVKQLLLSLQEQREKDGINCPYVFISKYGGEYNKVSNTTLNEWSKKIGNMIGIPTLHPHDFRHTQATLLKNAGMPLEAVSSLLNHAGTDVTLKHYIKADTKKIQAEKDKFDI
jgi:site-specific recombinase XerD